MATHSSILAWRIPWTEEPGELYLMGLQRVRHNWETNMHLHRCVCVCAHTGAHTHTLLGLCCWTGFSLVWRVGASLWLPCACSGFSYFGAGALGCKGLVIAAWALEHRLNSCGPRAYSLRGMWDLPWSGIKLVSFSLAGKFFTTEPPGKHHVTLNIK